MQVIAFYLTQFHPIPENDAIYGEGFTEWVHVRAAKPLFDGHYQPHVPHDLLGYYNLLDEKFLTLQHHLAFSNGIGAFCYYYYNINGHRLLEKPLKIISRSKNIQNNFCLCWVHASWYDNRTSKRIKPFLEQKLSRENAMDIIHDLEEYIENPRYITIDGKPLILVFAPERCEAINMYADLWREEALKMGLPGLCLAGVETFAETNPGTLNLDCMVEFAPNWLKQNIHAGDNGLRHMDYVKTVQFMLGKPRPPYNRMRCIFPAWDNTPRRGLEGIVCENESPELFRFTLGEMLKYTQTNLPDSMQYVFVNAWNEWAEGCHLEPDQKYGFAYLQIIDSLLKQYSAC